VQCEANANGPPSNRATPALYTISARTERAAPTAAMFPFSMTTAPLGISGPVIGITRAEAAERYSGRGFIQLRG
jgi:hypothetical protein